VGQFQRVYQQWREILDALLVKTNC
jgi:hypothetical protein